MVQAISNEQIFVSNLEQFVTKADKFIKTYYSGVSEENQVREIMQELQHLVSVTQWLQQREIIFGEMDLKRYEDGSFRLYFRVSNPWEGEYFRLVNTLMNKNSSDNKEKS